MGVLAVAREWMERAYSKARTRNDERAAGERVCEILEMEDLHESRELRRAMTDEKTIQPAMTPGQWAEYSPALERGAPEHEDGRIPGKIESFAFEGSRGLHAAAALALYGQPFGFTSDDVKLLERCEASVGWKHEEAVRKLAAKVAALLPPVPV